MEEGRLPKGVLEWRPSGRMKRGRPKLTWVEGIRGMMAEKGLQEEDWTDRNNWRRKITYWRNGHRKMETSYNLLKIIKTSVQYIFLSAI
jgi:hypothetical protein